MLAGYSTEQAVDVVAPVGGLVAGQVLRCAQFETRELAAAGSCRPDRRDFRLLYNGTEIDRVMLTTGSFAFRAQADLAEGEPTSAYTVNYGSPSESTDPKEDPRNVWSTYLDGNDLASFTGGAVSALDVPRPGFLKVGRPTLLRSVSPLATACLREVELYWDGTYFWASFDGYASETTPDETNAAGLARSTDLLTWEVRTPFGSGRNDVIIQSVPGQTDLVMTYFDHEGPFQGPVPYPPYTLHQATGPAPEGPWTEAGYLPRTSVDDSYNVDGHVFTFDSGATWYLIYGAADGNGVYGTHTRLASSATGPTGPWTKLGAVSDYYSTYENPRLLNDVAGNHAYLINNQSSYNSRGGIGSARGNVLQATTAWGNGVTPSFQAQRKFCVIEPGDPGEWDDFCVGVFAMPVIKDGMLYTGYDGSRWAEVDAHSSNANRAHLFRQGGFAEAPWPFRWGKAVLVGASPATTATLLAAGQGGEVRVKCDAGSVALVGGGESFEVVRPDPDEWGEADFQMNVGGSAVPSSNVIGCDRDNSGQYWTGTFLFRRRSGSLSVYVQSIPIWEGPSSAALSLRVANGIVEEVRAGAEPLDASAPAVTIDGSPLDVPLTVLDGSAEAYLASRLILPGTLKVWNGTALVDAPLTIN